jgi:hypothetical protein
MQAVDNIKLRGEVSGVINYADGRTEDFLVNNLVVTTGKGFMASRLSSNTAPAISHMAAGTGTTAADVANETLEVETGVRSAVTSSHSGNVETFSATFTGRTETMSEIGLFNASANGTLVARTLVGPYPMSSGDSISFNWSITVN